MMLIFTILIASFILQCYAFYLVFRLIKVSGKSLAWHLIAAAIVLMALQRGVRIGQLFISDLSYQPDLMLELIMLIISALMAFGIQHITPIIADLHSSAERQSESLIRYRTIFENSPISIWEEDFSAIKAVFDHLRRSGVTDIENHFEQHPEVVRQCAEQVKVVDVNRAALTLHGASSKDELLAGVVKTFTPESLDAFRAELICLWRGDTAIKRDTVVKTLEGWSRHVTIEYAVCPGFEESLSKIFVSLVDMTKRKEAELELKQALELTEGVINAIPDILFELNREGRYLNIWTRHPEMLIAPKEKMLGSTVNEVLPPDSTALVMAWIREADEKGFSVGNILRIDLPQGPHWFEHSLTKKPSDDPTTESSFLVLARDMTERMHMEEELRTSEQRFRAIFDQSFQFIGLLTTEGVILEANRAGLEFAGVEEREVVGKLFWETPWWRHSTELQQRLREAVCEAAGGKFLRFEVTHPDRDGRLHYVDFSLKPVTDSAGQVIQLIPEGRDITERKLADQERQLLADRLTNMDRINRAIQGAGDLDTMMSNVLDEVLGIYSCDRAFLTYPCDPTAKYIVVPMERTNPKYPGLGILKEEFPMEEQIAMVQALLLNTPGVVKFGPGTDRPMKGKIDERFGIKSLVSMALYPKVGKPWQFGVHQCSYDRIWTEVEEQLLEEIGQRLTDGLTSLLVLRDLRNSERQLIEAQHLAHLGNWELDLIENRLAWSDEIYRIVEVDKGQLETTYDAFLDAVHPDDRERVNTFYSGALKKHEPHSIVHRLLMKDGRTKYVNEQCETFYDVSEKPLRSIGTIQDITGQKQKEDELRHYRDHLEDEVRQRTEELRLARDAANAANTAKSAFLANMSHELRTPLNAILGFSHILQQDSSLNENQHETLHIINNSGEHLLKLINDVLEIAKIEAGKLQLEISSFDLHSLVREVTDMMRLRAQQKGLQLDLDQSSQFPRYIKGDEARLRQILVNLVSNAVKFTHEGGVVIRLRVKENTQLHLLLEVEDSGPGISEANQQRLFQPFVQLSDGDMQAGTGLGLSIVKQFVHLMGGTITIESTLGKGSLFHVELPLHAADEEALTLLGDEHHSNVVGLAPGQAPRRILIAEDQRDNQLLLIKLMTDIGLEVKVAQNGEECIGLFEDWRPDLILMDRRMPLMDGVEATKRIRQLPDGDKVKIVAVTASAFKEQKDELLAAGMDDFVRKPYKVDEIYQSLGHQLGLVFRFKEEQVEKVSSTLTPAMLAGLDDSLKSQLREALDVLDGEQLSTVIQRIGEKDQALAKLLKKFAGNFDYPTIMMALKKSTEDIQDT
jgi:PAS domain S-box-containing protein